jgi:medium-chain acyl-[acyl-carrier-protein] hydrolase
MESLQFEKEYRIHVYEMGPDGKLNLFSLFNYMQDIASEHAIKLGFGRDDLMRDNRFWVLSRMYAEFNTWPSWEDSIILRTWPNGIDRLFALRNYEVMYPDGRHIASGSSSWLILDRTTRKVQRPDSILSEYNPELHATESPVRYATKLEQMTGKGDVSSTFRIKASDLDINLHTNNVRYLNWVYDTYDLHFLMKNDPLSAEINYLAESVYDDEIIIRTATDKVDRRFKDHTVIRVNDNKELCKIRIGWKESDSN